MRTMISRVIIAILSIASCVALADTWTDPDTGYTWTYQIKGDEAELFNDWSAVISPYPNGNVAIPDTLGGKPVTSIGSYAFYKCRGLMSVTMPNSVTSIGNSAFSGCSDLTSMTMLDGVTSIGDDAFFDCSSLTSVTIPGSVTSIGSYAFLGCARLTIVTIPDSVISIGHDAFDNTPFYNNQPDGLVVFGKVAYKMKGSCPASVTIPEGVTSIGSKAFYNCTNLTSVTIPNSVTSIGGAAFRGCSELTSVTIPGSVTSIRSGAFENTPFYNNQPDGLVVFGKVAYKMKGICPALVAIPDSVTSIGDEALYNCKNLKSVTIGNGVTSIGDLAFYGCSGLTSVTIPDGVTSIGQYAFYHCNGLTSVKIPNSVTSIGGYAFRCCSALTLFDVGSGNPYYKSVSGLLLTKDGKTLVQGVKGAVTIPDGVTSIGDCAFDGCSGLMSVTIPDGVTRIGASAFSGCSGLTSVTIPNSVTSIGTDAFYICTYLTSVTIPDSVTSIGDSAFKYTPFYNNQPDGLVVFGKVAYKMKGSCPASVTIPEGVATIGVGAFCGCSGLMSVTIPDSVTIIRNDAFNGCSGLASVTIPDSVTSIGDGAFSGCSGLTSVTIPDSVTSIGNGAFSGCSGLTSVTIPDGVTSIGDDTFEGCNGLVSVTIPDGVTRIGDCAFYDCSGLTSVTIPDGVIGIGYSAFFGCSGLTSITISDSVMSIGSYAFYNCRGLMSVTIPNSVTSIGGGAFYGCSGIRDVTIPQCVCTNRMSMVFSSAYQSITNIVISDSVTSVGDFVFYDCRGLKSVRIGNGVTSIGECAFHNCSGLTSITISDSVMSIGSYAFYNCRGLMNVTIPNSVTSIGDSAFRFCSGLTSVTMTGNCPTIGSSVFSGVNSPCVAYLPRENNTYSVVNGKWHGMMVVYCDPVPAGPYTLTFDANGGEGGKSVTLDYGATFVAPTVTREGYTFMGWSPSVLTTVPAANVTYTAQWQANKYNVTFDANGGTGGNTMVLVCGTALAAPTVMREGYSFVGWSPEDVATVPASNVTYMAQWQINQYTVTFDANCGESGWSRSMAYGATIIAPEVTREGYTFVGWLPAVPATVPAVNVTYVAQWAGLLDPDPTPDPNPMSTPTPEPEEAHELYAVVEGVAPAVAASEYNGYLYDAGGVVKGTIQVKVGKPGKDGKASVKATVVVGTSKVALAAADSGKAEIAEDGPTTIQLVGGEACTVVLGAEGLSGSYGAYTIDGSRNFFSSKDKSEQGAANDLLTKWLGAVNVVWDGGNASVSIAKKGKAKVAVTLANGAKATANAQLLVGEKLLCVPVVVTKKANLAFALWLPLGDGQVIVDGLGNGAVAGKPGALGAGAKFQLDVAEFAAVFGQTVLPYLPDGIAVTQSGAKWALPKAGKVTYKDGAVDESKLGENPSGLKLTYKAKDGSFKGSFKVYAVEGGNAKGTTVNVTGVMVGTTGYGTATIKGKGSVAVTISSF